MKTKTDDPIPLDINVALAKKPRNRIARIGVELEGGWKEIPDDIALQADTSVFKGNIPPGLQCGELALGPMQRVVVAKMVNKYYPNKVDATCGLHVHMGFETIYQYMLLADSPAYQDTVVEYLGRWGKEEGLKDSHPLWSRLRGESVYCQKKFWPQEQMNMTRKDHDQKRVGHRYTMIHYCWGRYRTVECRLLPMMDTPEQANSVIKRLLDITNAYLLTVDKGKIRDHGKIELDNGDIYEEWVEVKL